MTLSGIDGITFGVEDLAKSRAFLNDWGLTEQSASADRASFTTRDGSEVVLRPGNAADLPAAIESGSTLREVIWGADDQQQLDRTIDALAQHWPVETGADGLVRCRDPNGLSIAFRVSRRDPIAVSATGVNAPGRPTRIDERAPIFERAYPIKVGHVVLFADDLDATAAFYQERLGFLLSDRYPGFAVFLRCQTEGVHHNLFLMSRPGKPGLNHVAYTVGDIHEVFGGGLAISRRGWDTEIGPGRHPISSAYFWYFKNPCGGLAEYCADEDYCTASWEARDFERRPDLFAEWAIAGGIDGTTRRQAKGA